VKARAASEPAGEADRIGFFGKVPTHGDFVSMGLDRHLQDAMDGWLQAGMRAGETDHGRTWKEDFAAMPVWRFVMTRSLWSPEPLAGVLLPSRDRVGRAFPLVIVARLASYGGRPSRLGVDDTWFTAAEAMGEASGRRDFDVNALIAGVKRLRMPHGDDEQPSAEENLSLWWRLDAETRKVIGFRINGMPQAEDFLRLAERTATTTAVPADPAPVAKEPDPVPIAAPPSSPLRISFSHATHGGLRTGTSDSILVSERVCALACGVGEQGAGDAAKLTTNMLASVDLYDDSAAMAQELKGKLGRAHGLLQSNQSSGEGHRTGSAVAALAFADDGVSIVWAGHVRAYLLRDGMMRALTRDHVEVGMRFALSRFVGSQRQFVPEVAIEDMRDGDRLLLCSSSLPRVLGERSIAEALIETPIEDAADALIQNALIDNARENLSAIAIGISR